MNPIFHAEICPGLSWLDATSFGLQILCGSPPNTLKHLKKSGHIQSDPRTPNYQTGPNAILIADTPIQHNRLVTATEFPLLHMLYKMPPHPKKPLLIGDPKQIDAQIEMLRIGLYGLKNELDMHQYGISKEESQNLMHIKHHFAEGNSLNPNELVERIDVTDSPKELSRGLTITRINENIFNVTSPTETITIDLTAPHATNCPYSLPNITLPNATFAITHTGQGDGWNEHEPCMASIVTIDSTHYLIDCGPNILDTLQKANLHPNELAGLIQTHAHDDHFIGLPDLLFARTTPLPLFCPDDIFEIIKRKYCALLSLPNSTFNTQVQHTSTPHDIWTPVNGKFEIEALRSLHPVETAMYRIKKGDQIYAHFTDITNSETLKNLVTSGVISSEFSAKIQSNLTKPATVKKIDAGNTPTHGNIHDFTHDTSDTIIVGHTEHTIPPGPFFNGKAVSVGHTSWL